MSDMSVFLDMIIIGGGVYMLYGALALRKGDIVANILLPRNVSADRLKDKEGFIKAIFMKLLVLSIVTVLAGAAILINVWSSSYHPGTSTSDKRNPEMRSPDRKQRYEVPDQLPCCPPVPLPETAAYHIKGTDCSLYFLRRNIQQIQSNRSLGVISITQSGIGKKTVS